MQRMFHGIQRRPFLKWSLAAGAGTFLPDLSAFGETSKSGSTLVVAALTTPAGVDQDFNMTAQSHELRMNTMERLMAFGLKASPEAGVREEDFTHLEPRLAESWEMNPEHTEIVFHLRKGVKSPRGHEFTSDDVKWTWDRAWALKVMGTFYFRSVLHMTEPGWTVLDKYTVRLRVPKPVPFLESLWVNMDLGIFDAAEAKKHASESDPWARTWISKNSPSFSPYYITSWQPGHQVTLTAWRGYYRGEPNIKRVVFEAIPESSSRLALLLRHDAHIAEDLSPRDFVAGAHSKGVKPVSLVGNAVYRAEFNNKMEPFTNSLVRQALNYAVDRNAIIKGPWDGIATVCDSPLPPPYVDYNGSYFKYKYDPQKAKSLLAKAGYPKGLSTTLAFRTGDATEAQMAQLIKTNMQEAGVNITLLEQSASSYVNNIFSHKYPIYLYVDSAIMPDPSYALNLWLNSSSPIDYSQYHNATVDELINKMLNTVSDTETRTLAFQAQKEVMEDPPWIYLVYPGYHVLLAENVSGFAWRTPVNPIEYYVLSLS